MSENTESVKYLFTGDSSQLRQATTESMSALTRFESVANRVATIDPFRAGAVGAQRFSSQLDTLNRKLATYSEYTKRASASASNRIWTTASVRDADPTNLTKYSASNAASGHSKLASAIGKVDSAITGEQTKIDSEKKKLSSKNSVVKKSAALHDVLQNIVKKVGNAFYRETGKLKNARTQFDGISISTKLLRNTFSALTGITVGEWLARATKESINFIENLNLFTVAMGESIEAGQQFVDTMQELYGMDPSHLYEMTGNFYQLASAIDMPTASAKTMALALTKATNDISSLFNMDIDTVFDNLSSGLQGMSRAVRKYGMDIRTTTLQQTALTLGVTAQVESMNEADRMGLRFITMMRQASAASGDFARTIETPANQLKIFKEQITQLGRAVGNFFIGPLTTAISYVNGFVMALRTALTFIAQTLSLLDNSATTNLGGVTDNLDDVGTAADSAAAKVQELNAPFDELNVLKENSADAGNGLTTSELMDPAISEAIAGISVAFENIEMKANKVRDALLEFFGFKVNVGEILQWDESTFWANIDKLEDMSKKAAEKLTESLNKSIGDTDAKPIGEAVGILLNAGVTYAFTFISTLEFDTLASKITDGLVATIAEIDFYEVGYLIGTKWHVMSEMLNGMLNSLESVNSSGISGWGTLGQKIADGFSGFIDSVDWGQLGVDFTRLAVGLIKMIITALGKVDWDDVGKSLAEFLNGIDLAQLFQSIFEGVGAVVTALSEAFSSLWDNADGETRALIVGAGILALIKPISTVIGFVTSLTGAFKNKNSALETQNGLETQAATNLATKLVPSLGLAAGASGVFAGGLGGVNDAFDRMREQAGVAGDGVAVSVADMSTNVQTSLTPTFKAVRDFSVDSSSYLITLGSSATYAADAFSDLGTTSSSLDASPISSFAETALPKLQSVRDMAIETSDALSKLPTTTTTTTGKPVASSSTAIGVSGVGLSNLTEALTTDKTSGNALEALEATIRYKLSTFGINTSNANAIGTAGLPSIGAGLGSSNSSNSSIYGAGAGASIGAGASVGIGAGLAGVLAFAKGGVITSPTYGLIGEGNYSEAVLPLENSPQMNDLISKIADAVKTNTQSDPVEVRVYIGDTEFDAYTYKASERGRKQVGAQLIRVGG